MAFQIFPFCSSTWERGQGPSVCLDKPWIYTTRNAVRAKERLIESIVRAERRRREASLCSVWSSDSSQVRCLIIEAFKGFLFLSDRAAWSSPMCGSNLIARLTSRLLSVRGRRVSGQAVIVLFYYGRSFGPACQPSNKGLLSWNRRWRALSNHDNDINRITGHQLKCRPRCFLLMRSVSGMSHVSTWSSPPRPSSARRPSSAPSWSPPAPPPSGGSGRSWLLLLVLSAGRCGTHSAAADSYQLWDKVTSSHPAKPRFHSLFLYFTALLKPRWSEVTSYETFRGMSSVPKFV